MFRSSCLSDIQVEMSSGKLDNVSMDVRSNTWTANINLETIVIRLVFKAMS